MQNYFVYKERWRKISSFAVKLKTNQPFNQTELYAFLSQFSVLALEVFFRKYSNQTRPILKSPSGKMDPYLVYLTRMKEQASQNSNIPYTTCKCMTIYKTIQ